MKLPSLNNANNVFSLIHQETNESPTDDTWKNSVKYSQSRVAMSPKITAEELANELLWLRLDQSYILAEKKKVTNYLLLHK